MTEAPTTPNPEPPDDVHDEVTPPEPRPRAGLGVVAILVLACAAILFDLRPPQEDAGGFSTEAAFEHLAVIAAEPRPLASEYNGSIREYLVDQFNALGLETRIQAHRYLDEDKQWDIGNVIALHPGTTRDSAVVLAAHFDSVDDSPGAADDGAAVAAMLEVARILTEAGPLRRDVYFLLTDGEERGLWGAQAFVQAADEIEFTGVVFNFEARGTTGASIMFETAGSNAWLIREFARCGCRPLASSISDDLYRHMPNDTDLTVFAHGGKPGLNFAFIGSPQHYHTPEDRIENLDPASLRHHGLTMLALARHFGNLETFGQADDANAVYFTAPWIGLVHYPSSLAVWTGIAAVLGAAVACGVGLWRRWIAFGRLCGAVVLVIVQMAVVGAVVYVILRARNAGLTATVDVAGHLLICGGTTMLIAAIIARCTGAAEMALAGIVWSAVFGLMTAPTSPASSHIFVWPALCGALAWLIARARPGTHLGATMSAVLTLPAIVILLPVAYLAVLGLGVQVIYALETVLKGYAAATVLAFFPALLSWHLVTPLSTMALRTMVTVACLLAATGVAGMVF